MIEETQFQGKFKVQVMRTIVASYQTYKTKIIVCFVIGAVARTMMLMVTNVTGLWADSLCKNSAVCKAGPMWSQGFTSVHFMILLLCLTFLGFLGNIVFRILISRTGVNAVSTLYDEVTYRTSRFPISYFDTTPIGRIVNRFNSDYGAIFRSAGGPMGEFLSLSFDLVATLILISLASVWYLPIVALTIGANYFVYTKNVIPLRDQRRQTSQIRGPAIAHFAETSQGARSIKIYARQGMFANRFAKLVHNYVTQRTRQLFTSLNFSLQMNVLTAVLLFLTGSFGILLVQQGLLTVGTLAVGITFVMMLSTNVQQFFEYLSQMEDALTGAERLDEMLRQPLEPFAALPSASRFKLESSGRIQVLPLRERRIESAGPTQDLTRPVTGASALDLSLQNLMFRYAPNLPLVLHDLSFCIPAGQHWGVVGKTGCGKSTLIQVILHLYPILGGQVLIGQHSIANTPLEDFRKLIGLIPQEPTLFRGSLRDNLVCDDLTNDAQLLAAMHAVGLAEWLSELGTRPLEYQLQERGLNLSGGQRQLLCMARCLVQQAPLIIMDEATSSVDPGTENLMGQTSAKLLKNKTRLTIAHRFSTLEQCDKIVWLEAGRVLEIDVPEVILRKFEHASV